MKVREIMTHDVVTVEPQTPLKEVARIMITRGISGLPVVDSEGNVLGVVSETDIVYRERTREPNRRSLLSHVFERGKNDLDAKLEARTAGEAMTAPAVTVEPTTRVPRAASMMTDRKISRLVVTERGTLVGIVTRADFVRAFARSDFEVELELKKLIQDTWVPTTVGFTVNDGVVNLTGELDSRAQADGLTAIVHGIPGVVAVTSQLHWSDRRLATSGRHR